jgi:uncharacterized protein (DUF1330 family)
MKGWKMSGEVYVIAETLEIYDADGFAAYQQGARAQLLARGGSVVARGSRHLEGQPAFGTVVIQKWPNEAAYLGWQDSAEYQPPKQQRLQCANIKLAVVPAL